MQYNNKFTMKDLFMNKQLKGLFPQFTKKEGLKNVYSFAWIDKKVEDYLKNVFNGRKSGDEIIISGKFKQRYKQIKGLQGIIENMFNNMPALTKNIRKNTKLITPFQCIDQLKSIDDTIKKIQVMEIVFNNIYYNDDFQFNGYKDRGFEKRKEKWLKSVGYYNKRR